MNEKTATTQIIIDVDLDEAPRFTSSNFVQLVSETAKAGDSIKQLEATDPDLAVSLRIFRTQGPVVQN